VNDPYIHSISATLRILRHACLLLSACMLMAQAPAPRPVAIRCGRLIDGKSATVRTDAVILIEGERIREVGSGLAIPAGAEVIESNANWNYSRSLLFSWAIPYYHMGFRATETKGHFTGGFQLDMPAIKSIELNMLCADIGMRACSATDSAMVVSHMAIELDIVGVGTAAGGAHARIQRLVVDIGGIGLCKEVDGEIIDAIEE